MDDVTTKLVDEARRVFLIDVDEDTFRENDAEIRNWEQALRFNEAFASWQESDISKSLALKAKEMYVESSLLLAHDRRSSEATRVQLYAKQDAALWFLSLLSVNTEEAINNVRSEIATKLGQV